MIVMEYANMGNLRNRLKNNYTYRSWRDIIDTLKNIISSLNSIHESNLIHCDLHDGNILIYFREYTSDLGLCKPIDYFKNKDNNGIYGVLPYIAPEVLRGNDYSHTS